MAAITGAYFASQLSDARASGRIGVVPGDPNLPVQAFADLGGTGARAR